jgi:hypothetical protein
MADNLDVSTDQIRALADRYSLASSTAKGIDDFVVNGLLELGPLAGDDVYGGKVSAMVNPVVQGTSQLLEGVKGNFDGTGTNLVTVADSFDKANNTNIDLTKGLVNP